MVVCEPDATGKRVPQAAGLGGATGALSNGRSECLSSG